MYTTLDRCIWALVLLSAFTTASDADRRRDSCRPLCGRISSCKIMSNTLCTKLCLSDPGYDERRAAAQLKMSCPALAKDLAPSTWVCTAEGASSYGHNLDPSVPGSGTTREVWMLGTGTSRMAAENQALRECNAILTFNLDMQRQMSDAASWSAEVTARCRITDCIGPGAR